MTFNHAILFTRIYIDYEYFEGSVSILNLRIGNTEVELLVVYLC